MQKRVAIGEGRWTKVALTEVKMTRYHIDYCRSKSNILRNIGYRERYGEGRARVRVYESKAVEETGETGSRSHQPASASHTGCQGSEATALRSRTHLLLIPLLRAPFNGLRMDFSSLFSETGCGGIHSLRGGGAEISLVDSLHLCFRLRNAVKRIFGYVILKIIGKGDRGFKRPVS